jgi:hypothetical protein
MKTITKTFLLLIFICNYTFSVSAQSNNNIANATKITSLPFTDSNVNIPNSDPNNANGLTGCSLTNRSVVYKFTPIVSGTVTVEIKTAAGTTGIITTIAANENATQTSDLSPTPDGNICHSANPKTTNVTAGQTYYFLALSGTSTDIEFTGTAVLSLTIPELTTSAAASISKISATLGGNITTDNGSAITERGVVYSITDSTPEIGEATVVKDDEGGSGSGSFSEAINLTQGTTYYYRAYATNANGTGYGEVLSFSTFNNIPTISTTDISNVATSTATFGGDVIDQGDSAVTERGILYSTTNATPKITDTDVTKDANGTGTGSFSESIGSLTTNTNVYYYRAYATNNQGTGYGVVKSFAFNNGLHFLNSGSTRVTIPDNVAFDFSSGFTAEAWIKADALATRNVFSQYGSSQEAFSLFLLSDGTFEFTVTTDGSTDQYFTTNNTGISTGVWHHVAVTFDGSTMRAYVDGVASGTGAALGAMFNSTAPVEIGARNNAHFFDGTIDEVRFWSRALTQAEIDANKNTKVPSNAESLIAYYRFNEGTAEGTNTGITTLTDSGSNNLTGTLNNFTLTGTTSNFVAGVNGNSGITDTAPNTFDTTGDWSTASNWSLGVVPAQIENVTIANGVTVTVDVDDLQIKDFTLASGATLNIPKDKEITITGSFNSDSGTLELSSDTDDSGVLFIKGSSSGNVTYKRGGLLANEWSIVTPPVSGQTVKTFAENVANDIRINTAPDPDRYAIAYYDDSQSAGNKWVYYDVNVNAATEFIAGESYAMSRSTNGEVSFTGILTAANVTKTLTGDQWSAIGNPFTTYYPANKNSNSSFINDNASALDDSFQSVYVWDNTQSKYVAVSEVDANNRSLPPGQGFFVRMKAGQTEITFNEAKRSVKPASGTTNFSRNTHTTSGITLQVTDGSTTVDTQIKYFNNTSRSLDPGYDIGNFDGASLDVFTQLLENNSGVNYTIQSLSDTDYENTIIPIGVKAASGANLVFSSELHHFPTGINVYLEDRTLGVFTLLENSNTTYSITLDTDISTTGRFYLHTTSQTLSIEGNAVLEGVSFYQLNQNTLRINGLQAKNYKLSLFNLLGQELIATSFTSNGVSDVPLTNVSAGIYIVRLHSESGVKSVKIILE